MVENTIQEILETEAKADEIMQEAKAQCCKILEEAKIKAESILKEEDERIKEFTWQEREKAQEEGNLTKQHAQSMMQKEIQALKELALRKQDEAICAVISQLV